MKKGLLKLLSAKTAEPRKLLAVHLVFVSIFWDYEEEMGAYRKTTAASMIRPNVRRHRAYFFTTSSDWTDSIVLVSDSSRGVDGVVAISANRGVLAYQAVIAWSA